MTTGKELSRAACVYLGRLYSEMDCQKFVETALADVGIRLDLAGSNSWLREVNENGWIGTPEECISKFGCVPDGAFLFIREFDGKEPEKYRGDGLGNASHIGIYTGMTGQEMVDIAVAAGNKKAVNYYYGNGAIHSSAKREHVATSDFKNKSINGGWNLVGLWNRIDYGDKINTVLKGGVNDEPVAPDPVESEPDLVEEPKQPTFATIWAESGETVNIRKEKSTHSKLVERVPIGAMVRVIKEGKEWSKVCYTDKAGAKWYGFMMSEFLKNENCVGSGDGQTVVVCVPFLTRYQAEALMKKYPGSWIESGVG